MSRIDSPAISSARRAAGTTPVSCITGSEPTATRARKRARGRMPSASAASRRPTSTAAAPSDIWLAFRNTALTSGAVLIIASGLYIVFREARRGVSTNRPVSRTRARGESVAAPRPLIVEEGRDDASDGGSR